MSSLLPSASWPRCSAFPSSVSLLRLSRLSSRGARRAAGVFSRAEERRVCEGVTREKRTRSQQQRRRLIKPGAWARERRVWCWSRRGLWRGEEKQDRRSRGNADGPTFLYMYFRKIKPSPPPWRSESSRVVAGKNNSSSRQQVGAIPSAAKPSSSTFCLASNWGTAFHRDLCLPGSMRTLPGKRGRVCSRAMSPMWRWGVSVWMDACICIYIRMYVHAHQHIDMYEYFVHSYREVREGGGPVEERRGKLGHDGVACPRYTSRDSVALADGRASLRNFIRPGSTRAPFSPRANENDAQRRQSLLWRLPRRKKTRD